MENHIQNYKTAATAKNKGEKNNVVSTLDLINTTNFPSTYKNPTMPLLPLLEPLRDVNYGDLQA